VNYWESIDELNEILREFFRTKKDLFDAAVNEIYLHIKAGKKIVAFGNGGSAAQAQHFTAELVGRFKENRKALPALSLTTDCSLLTALSNDWSFSTVFSRQIEALGEKDDIALALSTSGDSSNVVEAVKSARQQGLFTIALTGQGGGLVKSHSSLLLDIPSVSTERIQEAHLFLLHIMAGQIESRIFEGS